jgi:1-deoxy-D-xylulose-5-phosphate reductoisomerase
VFCEYVLLIHSASPQVLTVLGSTGSIGTSTLDVVARHPQRFQIYALSAHRQVEALLRQCAQFRPQWAVMTDRDAATALTERMQAEGLATRVLFGSQALCEVSSAPEVDTVMAAIVGAAGLPPSLAAARAGKRLLLANKEAVVLGGRLFMDAVSAGGARLLPIDSEHSAIFQSLPEDASTWDARVEKIILTASGGPFRTRDPQTLHAVTPAQAVAHPNWDMGRKISVDSATMMNKALEVIEAHHLFGMPPERLEVVIHPQSVIHSMVQYRDSSVVAQLGTPDMRVPIAYGLSWPERMTSGAQALDFTRLGALTFEVPDPQRFAGLGLAWEALLGAPGSTAKLNAANEVAVQAFLDERIRFDHIHVVNADVLALGVPQTPSDLDALFALDALAREQASAIVQRLAG